jgi:hypothetical protein
MTLLLKLLLALGLATVSPQAATVHKGCAAGASSSAVAILGGHLRVIRPAHLTGCRRFTR